MSWQFDHPLFWFVARPSCAGDGAVQGEGGGDERADVDVGSEFVPAERAFDADLADGRAGHGLVERAHVRLVAQFVVLEHVEETPACLAHVARAGDGHVDAGGLEWGDEHRGR